MFKIAPSLLFLLLTLITACTAPPTQLGKVDTNVQQRLEQLTHWTITGRFAFKSSEEKFSANMNWQQQDQAYDFRLSSFIGTTLMHMQGQPGAVTLIVDDKTYKDTDAAALIGRITGWNIPLNKLADWAKGQIDQDDRVQFDPQGLVKELIPGCTHSCPQASNQWQLSYGAFKLYKFDHNNDNAVQRPQAYWLPHVINLQHRQIPTNQIKIRINQWTTP